MYYDLTMAQAKKDFERGLLLSARLEFLDIAGVWVVVFVGVGHEGYLIDARFKIQRMFRTLDSAVSALRSVGFQVRGLVCGR